MSDSSTSNSPLKPETQAVHAGQVSDPTTGARAVPIYQTTSFVFRDAEHASNLFGLAEFGNIYTRLMNPTTDVWEKRIAALEGGTAAVGTSSGMAAIFLTIHNLAQAGDHIVASSSLYGGTETLFHYTMPQIGIDVTFITEPTADKVTAAINDRTKAVYLETIGNPRCDVPDFSAISDAAHKQEVPVIVDNTFAPVICQPIKYGVDIVVHSCTKWIGGHGTSIGGVIVDGGSFDWSNGRFSGFTKPDPTYHGLVYWDTFGNHPALGNVAFALKARVQECNLGMCPSPFNAFLFLQGLETLPLRIQRHCENAMALAKYLKQHPKVSWVVYSGLDDNPTYANASKYLSGGFGAVLGFGIQGGLEAGEKFINSVQLCSHLANVGDAKTLVLHPASTSHRQMNPEARQAAGVTEDFIRVSVGVEHIDDIIADIDQALQNAT